MIPLLLGISSSTPPVSENVRSRPQIVGGTLRTDTGQLMRFGRSPAADAPTKSAATWAAGRALGLNGIRVGFNVGAKTLSETAANLDLIIDAARNNRMYVMLCNAETSPGTWGDNIAANRARQIEIWSFMAARYKDEQHVFYEQLNEPEAWGLWSHYANASAVPTALLVALRDVYNVIRAAAPDTVVLLPSPANLQATGGAAQYIHAIQGFETLGPVDWDHTVWSFHYYNQTMVLGVNNGSATDGGRAGLAWLSARYPIACTETNWWMESPRAVLIDGLDAMEDAAVGHCLMSRPGQTGTSPNPFPGDLFPDPIANKYAQLRARGYVIPVE